MRFCKFKSVILVISYNKFIQNLLLYSLPLIIPNFIMKLKNKYP